MKEGESNFCREPILQNVWIIWSPFLYFNFKSFVDPNSLQFISFQCILYDSGVLLSGFSNLYKVKMGNLISVGSQFCRISELFGPPSLFQFKSFLDPNSSPFISFQCILYDSGVLFSGFSNLYKLKRGGFNFWVEPSFQNVWIIWSHLLYLNLKSSMDQNSSSFIRFQFILHESGRLFWESWNFYKLKRAT